MRLTFLALLALSASISTALPTGTTRTAAPFEPLPLPPAPTTAQAAAVKLQRRLTTLQSIAARRQQVRQQVGNHSRRSAVAVIEEEEEEALALPVTPRIMLAGRDRPQSLKLLSRSLTDPYYPPANPKKLARRSDIPITPRILLAGRDRTDQLKSVIPPSWALAHTSSDGDLQPRETMRLPVTPRVMLAGRDRDSSLKVHMPALSAAKNPKKLARRQLLQQVVLQQQQQAQAPAPVAVKPAPVVQAPAPKKKMLSSSYYADWTSSTFPPESIDYAMYDVIAYSFAGPKSDFSLDFSPDSAATLARLVKLAHKAGTTKVVIALGGWTDSTYFSDAVATEESRTIFVNNVKEFVQLHGLDGVDVDWEYPGTMGAPGNHVSSLDTSNFFLFLRSLRSALPSGSRISAAASHTPWISSSGSASTDLSAFAQVLDSVFLMNYDVYSSSSTPGPNAPLGNACGDAAQPQANEVAALERWIKAGVPADKLTVGVPYYGYVSATSTTSLVHKQRNKKRSGLNSRAKVMERKREAIKSPLRRWREAGLAKLELAKKEQEREARVARSRVARGMAASKKVVVCGAEGDHSNAPCSNDQTSSTNTVVVGSTTSSSIGNGDLTAFLGQQINFQQLVSSGALHRSSSTGRYEGSSGFARQWDSCSQTPFLINKATNTVVSYDDQSSLRLKAAYAKLSGAQGVGSWSMDGDTDAKELVKAVRIGMGL